VETVVTDHRAEVVQVQAGQQILRVALEVPVLVAKVDLVERGQMAVMAEAVGLFPAVVHKPFQETPVRLLQVAGAALCLTKILITDLNLGPLVAVEVEVVTRLLLPRLQLVQAPVLFYLIQLVEVGQQVAVIAVQAQTVV